MNMATAFFNISFSNSTSRSCFFNFIISSLLVTSPVDVVIVPYLFIQFLILAWDTPYSLDYDNILSVNSGKRPEIKNIGVRIDI